MEALKFLALNLVLSLAAASLITYVAGLAMDPLERARQRWIQRAQETIKARP
jgi:hypothetical protein